MSANAFNPAAAGGFRFRTTREGRAPRFDGPRNVQGWLPATCSECGAKKSVRPSKAMSGNPGECCGQVLVLGEL